ncbi:hypothetical protein MOX02_24190 [Methylobacterium oxalidis]|uniref:DUF6894 domain-containing protein n=1 Tax=Methylobacterium oxalidis TaxID=944322 RepID=A0A512J367_9HYPH|nr:hypothetical protein MOX02_24190 [Methylobacterium oxalidis]GLS62753.1 hypothetical protein GCM10007888_11340 [Methylobacterium oxalidis]
MMLRQWATGAVLTAKTRVPRFFFDIHDGETIHDEEGHNIANLDAARAHARHALSEMLAYELRQGNTPSIRVHVRNEAGAHVLTARGRGEVLIDEAPEGVACTRVENAESGTLSPLDRAAQHAMAAQRAIDADGSAALRHWADMLVWAIERAILRRPNAASRRKPE